MESVDIKTLERLAARLESVVDAGVHTLNSTAMLSVIEIIKRSIGAPLMWPSRSEGVRVADQMFSGSPSMRLAFNAGVKWAVESYQPSWEHDK